MSCYQWPLLIYSIRYYFSSVWRWLRYELRGYDLSSYDPRPLWSSPSRGPLSSSPSACHVMTHGLFSLKEQFVWLPLVTWDSPHFLMARLVSEFVLRWYFALRDYKVYEREKTSSDVMDKINIIIRVTSWENKHRGQNNIRSKLHQSGIVGLLISRLRLYPSRVVYRISDNFSGDKELDFEIFSNIFSFSFVYSS